MIQQVTASNNALESECQIPSVDTCSRYLPSTGTLTHLFWNYFQLTCILWNQILIDKHMSNDSLMKKITHAIQVATVIFEQSPQDVQSCIIKNFGLNSDTLLICGRVAIAAIEGKLH